MPNVEIGPLKRGLSNALRTSARNDTVLPWTLVDFATLISVFRCPGVRSPDSVRGALPNVYAGAAVKAAALIQQGIGKVLKKIPAQDAYITLGLAQAKNKNAAEANRAFGKVAKDDNYERLAKLWSLRTK